MTSVPDPILLWLEPTPPGSAARTHLNGTLQRLRAQNITPRTVLTSEESTSSLRRKASRLLTLSFLTLCRRPGGILIARWHPFLALVTPIWRKLGGRVLLLVQGNDATMFEVYPWMRRMPFSGQMVKASLVEADSLLVLNEGLAKWIEDIRTSGTGKKVPPKPRVLPTGVSNVFLQDRPEIAEANKSAHITGAGTYALFFGNLAPWQGVATLVESVHSDLWPAGVKVLVAGDGADRELVVADASPLIEWVGRKSQAELADLIRGALCTICPKTDDQSMAETTTPFKILESVAVGTPVIASNIPAQERMVTDGKYGLLFRVNDADDLAASVNRISSDANLHQQLATAADNHRATLTWEYGAEILVDEINRIAMAK